MTYVKDRRVIDADSHLMEWPGFLTDYAPTTIRADLPTIAGGSSGFQTKAFREALKQPSPRRGLFWSERPPPWKNALSGFMRQTEGAG